MLTSDPICARCSHPLSKHRHVVPEGCYDLGVADGSYCACECKGFRYHHLASELLEVDTCET